MAKDWELEHAINLLTEAVDRNTKVLQEAAESRESLMRRMDEIDDAIRNNSQELLELRERLSKE